MSNYSQNFTLKDIFNNKKLADKLPLINFNEKSIDGNKLKYSTKGKTITRFVYDTSRAAAKPYYKPLNASKSGDNIIIGGTLKGDYSEAYNAIYEALLANKQVMIYTVNNADIIRDALVETEKNKVKYGIDSKLYLRANSMEEIEGMSKPQIQALLQNIMENIMFGDDCPKTQRKWQVEGLFNGDYERLKALWKRRVGY